MCHKQLCRFPPFVVVSYAWRPTDACASHPDPEAHTLRGVLAPAIEWYMAERARLIQGGGAYGAPPLRNPFSIDGCDFCVFLDYSSCYQHSVDADSCDECKQRRLRDATAAPCEHHRRSTAQEASYQRARASMDILYAHAHTCVWRLTHTRGQSDVPYADRAWPLFETAVSCLVKFEANRNNRLDLGTAAARSALANFKGRAPRSAGALALKASYCHMHKAGVHRRLRDASRPVVIRPEEFAEALRGKRIAQPSDRELLLELQRKVATAVLNDDRRARNLSL